jgi:hypothetical protein
VAVIVPRLRLHRAPATRAAPDGDRHERYPIFVRVADDSPGAPAKRYASGRTYRHLIIRVSNSARIVGAQGLRPSALARTLASADDLLRPAPERRQTAGCEDSIGRAAKAQRACEQIILRLRSPSGERSPVHCDS